MNTTILASTTADRDAVYRLRYSCYLRTGAIAPCPAERFSDHYDDLPNQFSFLNRDASGEPRATVRISVVRPDLGWTKAPSLSVFGEHPAMRPIAAGSFVEANRLCFAQQARRDALMGVVSYLAALADFHEVDWVVACPREEHSHAYEKMFGFEPLAEPRQYFGVNFRTSLLAVSRAKLRRNTDAVKPMNGARVNALDYLTRLTSSSLALAIA